MNDLQRIETTGTLENLAGEINNHHRACEQAVGTALEHAIGAGELLAEVKSQLPHGAFGPWLKESFAGSDRTARAYMRVARHRGELEAKTAGSAVLSLGGALTELTAPSEDKMPYASWHLPDGDGGWSVKHYYSMEEYAAAHNLRVSPPLLVDAEFDGLLPPLADDEYAGLERSLLQEGCHNAIIAWSNTILDGHARYEICVKHSIDYLVADKEMESRNHAMIYIIHQQLGRKNLSLIEKAHIHSKAEVDRLTRERGISEEEAWEELLGAEDEE